MTRKHFEAVALILKAEYALSVSVAEKARVITIAQKMADMFVDENPRFDYSRFMAACGMA